MNPLPDAYKKTVRRWVVDEHVPSEKLGNLIVTHFDAGPLREWAHDYVNELLAEQAARTRPPTALQAEWIPKLEERARYLQRTTGRVSRSALATWSGVDRGTIAKWEKAEILKL